MKSRALLCSLLAVLCLPAIAAAKPGWTDDYAKAMETAKAENKIVLLDFTGSDWCGWCMKLDDEFFSKTKFKSFAKENLVLVEVDFPRGKSLSKKLKAQNDELAAKFGIRGYPTIILLDAEGKQVGRLGYSKTFLDDLKSQVAAAKK